MVRCLILLVALGCQQSTRKKREKLTLYCAVQVEWCELTKNRFEQSTGISVAMIRKSSGEVYAQVWAERRNPKGDVWYGGTGDAHLQAAEANLLEPYPSPRLPELHRWAVDPSGREHRTTGIYMGALGFAYNTDWIKRTGYPPPKGWKELLDDRYKGEIQMANPQSSGTAYTMLATIVQLFGEEDGFRYLDQLHGSVNQYTKSGAAPMRAAGRGETGIGIAFLHDAMTEKAAGFSLELVAPEEGTGFEIGCVSVIRGARHMEAAKRFVDFALSPEGQEIASEVHAYQIPSNTRSKIPSDAPRVDRVKLIDFDYKRYGSKAERTRLLSRWEKDVKR